MPADMTFLKHHVQNKRAIPKKVCHDLTATLQDSCSPLHHTNLYPRIPDPAFFGVIGGERNAISPA